MKTNFCRIMASMALRYRDNLAVVNLERRRRYTFLEYHRLTNRVANMARERLGLRAGDTAMLILENDNLSLIHFPAIFKQEAAFAFCNIRDSLAEHSRQIDHVRPKVVFIETALLRSHLGMLRDKGCTIVVMDDAPDLPDGVFCFNELVVAASDADNDVTLDAGHHVAILRFTGGTTASGKCAMYAIDHFLACRDSVYAQVDLGFDEDTRNLLMTPLSHAGFVTFLPTFFSGGAIYTLNAANLTGWCEAVERERITHSLLVPTLLYRLLDMNASGTHDLASLRTVIYAASPIAPAAVNRLVETFGSIFAQFYGASETFMLVSMLNRREHIATTDVERSRLGSAGRVTPGVELVITDDDGNPLPPGQTGEIRLRTRATLNGYYKGEEATRAEFKDGYWLSGDLGYVDENGYLFIVDRKKDMIITGGFNVYAVEVEAALAEHPAVLMSAVVGVPHPEWGEAVHAEVILRLNMPVRAGELIDHVKARLGGYKAPKAITFVDELPLSPVGKLIRRQVRQRYWEGHVRKVN